MNRTTRRQWLAGIAAMLAGVAFRARAEDARLAFSELYRAHGVLGIELSDRTRSLAGKRVQVLGYLAPPLKPDVAFFVLTRAPVAICPFCNSDADWPSDIIVVYPHARFGWKQDGTPVAVSGTLEIGSRIDQATGFVSLVRIVDAEVKTLS